MKGYTSDTIRNVALLGHGSSGKTTFLEAALLATGVVTRLGRVEDGNAVSDWDKMEIEKGYSINTSLVPVEDNKTKINFVDTPGFFDFVGEVESAVRAVEAALIVVDASSGIEVGTEKAWNVCKKNNLPRLFLINKIDKDNVDVDEVIEALKDKFGTAVVTMDDKDALSEAIAETDEELMDKYFEGEEFTDEEFARGLSAGILSGDVAPVLQCSALKGDNIEEVLKELVDLVPKPTAMPAYPAKNMADEDVEVVCDPAANFKGLVFKTLADQQLGKISYVKVIAGTLKAGELYNANAEKPEKAGSLLFMRGKNRVDADQGVAGDIVAITKLQNTKTGDTLCTKADAVIFPPIDFPKPTFYIAVEAAKKGDEEKMGTGLARLMEEDPSFVLERNVETHQSLLGGQGEQQLSIITAKLKERFGVDVERVEQKIAYRETIKGTSDVQGKHKKQTGGAGQYGDVHIRFAPSDQEFEFKESLFGGSVPKNYVPAVEKGLRESMEKGPLAGCKVVGVSADLYDGSYHPVDSNEMAFKIAASLAFKKGIVEAKPCLLEPIMHLDIIVPEEYMGDIMGDMNKRRGRILGSEPMSGGLTKIMAEAPQSELFDYAVKVRSMTQARGTFEMTFERYDQVPGNLADAIIKAHQAEEASK